jgi:hypothetical protein
VNSIAKPDSKGNRLGVLFGPSVVFGVAPSPAYGVSVSGTYKFERWSAMLGARAAYAFGPIEEIPLDVIAFTGLAGPCFREKWFSACGFASLNIINWIPTAPTSEDYRAEPRVTPGIGIGVGGRYPHTQKIGFYLNSDATILAQDVELIISRANSSTTAWTGNQFLFSISLGVDWTP